MNLVLSNGLVCFPWGIEPADIGIDKGKIIQIEAAGSLSHFEETIDCKGLHIMPGVIDSQVHFREPGLEHKEDLHTGTKSAVLGGVTSILEMPNTKPPTTSIEAMQDKVNRGVNRAYCDYGFFMGGTEEDLDWKSLESVSGCSGIKIFMGSSTGNLLVSEDEKIRNILKQSLRRSAIHCEDEQRLIERKYIAEEGAHARYHHHWRDSQSAYLATSRLLKIAREVGARVHVLHVTTAEEMVLLAKNKDICTVEVTPQHLTFNSDAYETLTSRVQMNPPIREEHHRKALWEAIRSGVVDVIGSDHAPHLLEEKSLEYPKSPSGMPGVQTILNLMLHHYNQGMLPLGQLVDLLCTSPARIYGIRNKGRIALGYDADFSIVDLNHEWEVKDSDMASKCGWTPYHGQIWKGKARMTIIRGQLVMCEDQVLGDPIGKVLSFEQGVM